MQKQLTHRKRIILNALIRDQKQWVDIVLAGKISRYGIARGKAGHGEIYELDNKFYIMYDMDIGKPKGVGPYSSIEELEEHLDTF